MQHSSTTQLWPERGINGVSRDYRLWLWLSVEMWASHTEYRYVLIGAHALLDAKKNIRRQKKKHHIKFTPNCLIKHQKIVQKQWKTWKFKLYSSLFGCRTWANRHFLVNKGLRGSCFPYTGYMHIVGTGRQAILLKLMDTHPSPYTRALRFY